MFKVGDVFLSAAGIKHEVLGVKNSNLVIRTTSFYSKKPKTVVSDLASFRFYLKNNGFGRVVD